MAESNREDAEGLRVQAENTRAANDATWNQNEQTRQANEAQRVLAEQARVEAEAGRQAELDSKITYGSKWYDGSGGVAYADNADQLNSPDFTTDQVPYLYRTSGGDADIGNREKDTIVGGSLGWNQLFTKPSSGTRTVAGLTVVSDGDTAIINGTYTGSSNAEVNIFGDDSKIFDFIKDHVYLSLAPKLPTGISGYNVTVGNTALFGYKRSNGSTITKALATGTSYSFIRFYGIANGTVFTNYKVYYSVIDLTACFGATIADYIYSLEQATAGAGVAWFRKLFPKPYYPYKAIGGFLHVKLISHDMVHFNQWDEEWELGDLNTVTGAAYPDNTRIRSKYNSPIRVIPNTNYYFKSPNSLTICAYDVNDSFIEQVFTNNGILTTPNNCQYLRFAVATAYGTTYKNDICINLSWSGWRNGQYEAYKKKPYPLDQSVILRGIPKLDADNNLYYDGDRYESTGKVTRKFGVVDLRTLDWTYDSNLGGRFNAPLDGVKIYDNNRELPLDCPIYECKQNKEVFDQNWDMVIYGSSNSSTIYVHNRSYTSASDFKSAMSGVYLVYPLNVSTEETADPFQETQEVDDFGTEEYVVPEQDGVSVPVGHYTEYPENLRDKLRRFPNMPTVSESTTATYAVNYNGQTKKCSFVPINDWLVANGYPAVQDLSSQITDLVGLTYTEKHLSVIGNLVTLTIRAQNKTGSAIVGDNTSPFFNIPQRYAPTNPMFFACGLPIAQQLVLWSTGSCYLNGTLNNNDYLVFSITYAK